MAKHKGSLLRQLTLGLGLAIVFLSLASFYYQYQTERYLLTESIQGNLVRQAQLLRSWLGQAKTDAQLREVARQYTETIEYMDESGHEVLILDSESRVLASTSSREYGEHVTNYVVRNALDQGGVEPVVREWEGDIRVGLAFETGAPGKQGTGVLMVQHPLTSVDILADRLMLATFLLLAVTLAAIVLVVHVVLRLKVHKPIQAIWMQEYRIREGDLARIEAPDPNNEFSDLYAMYNEMVMRIADQKRAILEQKDHAALGQLVRGSIDRLTGPLDEILTKSRTLLERESSLSEDDRKLLKEIIGNITHMARELKAIVVEGDKSADWLQREAGRLPSPDSAPDETPPLAEDSSDGESD
ncbi:MAG: hypothetical protein R6V58_16045, partial [Planctomycetota bacterium]